MENHAAKKITKLPTFKIMIFNSEIECTNFIKFNRHDFLKLLVGFLYAVYFFLNVFSWPVNILLIYLFPKISFFMIPYYIWMFLDRKTPLTTGRKCKKKGFRNHPFYAIVRDYFPSSLVKTCDLPAGQNYLLAIYPHGIFPFSTLVNFLTNANKVDDLFPGIDFRCVVHDYLFFMPLVREYSLTIGLHSCRESSLKFLLTSPPSKGIIIYPGGQSEIPLVTADNEYKINMSARKGFIRMALITGTPLVPVFNFGEKNIYDIHATYQIKQKIVHTHGSEFFYPNGRGIFQNHFGWIPKQCPVTAVVGEPIYVPKVQNPSAETIDLYHKKFFDALYVLFEKYKHSCDVSGSEAKLIML